MQTYFYFTIHNCNALNGNSNMVVGVTHNQSTGQYQPSLQPYVAGTYSQIWQLIPNIVPNAVAGGYTLYCQFGANPNTTEGCLYCPDDEGQPVSFNDDPTPFGTSEYCWTMFDHGTYASTGEQLLTIQDYQQTVCLAVQDDSITTGAQLIVYPWQRGGDNNNARWILRPFTPPAPTSSN